MIEPDFKMKRGNSEEDEEDRISRLPESLIHHILSFMSTTYAVQTCVLSKRWQYIWISMPVLRFRNNNVCDWEASDDKFYPDPPSRTKGFLKFVDRVLKLRDNNSDIQRFELQCSNFTESRWKIYRFIAAAVSRNVQEIYIKTDPDQYGFEIPPCLCNCESLTKMELKLCGVYDEENKFILPPEMSLPRLKSLHLKLNGVSLHDEKLTNGFFSSFPSLESLILELKDGLMNVNLNISLPKLEYFKYDCWNYASNEVKLHAPSLASFIFKSDSTSFILDSLPALVNADIEIQIRGDGIPTIHEGEKEFYAQHCTRFLRGVHKVKVLTLGSSFIKVKFNPENIGDYWEAELSLPCMIFHLKFVEIKGLHGCVNELKFLEILLKHAMVLEKVILNSYSTKSVMLDSKEDSQRKKRMKKFREMLRKFPTASKKIVILLNS